MSRASHVLRAAVAALFALALVRCSSFAASGEPRADADAGAEASSEGSSAPVDASADAAREAQAQVRTGVLCSGARTQCAVGESCCGTGSGEPRCARDCTEAGATFTVFACGRTSDCAEGEECCGSQNGTEKCDGYAVGASCVPVGNCHTCSDGGGHTRLCDPSGDTECQGKTCTLVFRQSIYTGCSL